MKTTRYLSRGFISAKHIFIVGCGHSGTSLLLSRLANHPQVLVVDRETRLFQKDPLRKAWELIRLWYLWAPERRLCEKTPIHCRYLSEIYQVFPNAVVIACVRNPMDTIASLFKRYGNLEQALRRYERDTTHIAEGLECGEVQFLLRYEEFVRNPDQVLATLLEAADLGQEPSLATIVKRRSWYSRRAFLRFWRHASDHERCRDAQISERIVPRFGSYKNILNEQDARDILGRTASIARSVGYQ